jgi:3-oxoacyl-[acyl-carrier protein] reductase
MISIDLSGKHALVCGSTQGIGKAIAIAFAQAGASVVLAARNTNTLQSVKQELETLSKQSDQVHNIICADFSHHEEVEHAVRDYLAVSQKPIHILVNNTGGPAPGSVTEASGEDFVRAFVQHIVVNQTLTQLLLPQMKQEGYGRIINIVSTSVKQPIPNLGVSNTIRGAVASWAKTVSFEVARYGITINNILPGFIKTARLEALAHSIANAQHKEVHHVEQDMLQTIPAGRFGEASELGQLAAFLASPLAAYITGTSIAIDGGRTTAL